MCHETTKEERNPPLPGSGVLTCALRHTGGRVLCCKGLPTHPFKLQKGIRLEKGHNGHDVLETRAIGLLFPSCMIPSSPGHLSHKSYEKLSQFMHCSTAENEDPADKITKVRPLNA